MNEFQSYSLFDQNIFQKNCFGDEALQKELLELFVDQLYDFERKFDFYTEKFLISQIFLKDVHTLKGSSRTIGVYRFLALLEHIEKLDVIQRPLLEIMTEILEQTIEQISLQLSRYK